MLITPHLVGYWPFEGNANDASGNGNNGTVHGASLTTGKFGKCYSFDGVDDYISIGNLGIGNEYSASCWIKPNKLTNGNTDQEQFGFTIMASAASGQRFPLWLTVKSSEVRLWAYETDVTTGYYETTGAGITIGEWVHIVATAVSGSISKVYVNGIERLSFTNDGEVPWSDIFTIGDLRPDRGICFNGLIDQVQIYNKALSQSDIKRVMLGLHPLNG